MILLTFLLLFRSHAFLSNRIPKNYFLSSFQKSPSYSLLNMNQIPVINIDNIENNVDNLKLKQAITVLQNNIRKPTHERSSDTYYKMGLLLMQIQSSSESEKRDRDIQALAYFNESIRLDPHWYVIKINLNIIITKTNFQFLFLIIVKEHGIIPHQSSNLKAYTNKQSMPTVKLSPLQKI